MLRLGADREIRRDRQPRRLCLAGSHAARPRHHGRLRPAQERKRQGARFGQDGARNGRHPVLAIGAHAAMTPALNPALDAGTLAEAYARDRRIHIPAILTETSAARVHQCLAQETDYALLCQAGADQAQAWRVATLDPQKERELMTAAYGRARDRFDYFYDAHSLSKEGEPYPNPAHYLAEINRFFNGQALLDFIRTVTGRPEINATSIQATRYRQGHFLNQHDDGNDPRRIAAYVLNMTPHWRWDW